MRKINRKDIDLRSFPKHREFLWSCLEVVGGWFQLICFLYVAINVILMADAGETEKSINWALVALIIKPFGRPVKG